MSDFFSIINEASNLFYGDNKNILIEEKINEKLKTKSDRFNPITTSDFYKNALVNLKNDMVWNNLIHHMRVVLGSERISGKLDEIHPGSQMYFGNDKTDSDRSPVFEACQINSKDITDAIKLNPKIKASWVISNNPFNWLMGIVITSALLQDKPKKDIEVLVFFLTIHLYVSIQFKFFRRFYNPNIMAYAVNNLSDKFKLKKMGTIGKTLMIIAWDAHEHYKDDLLKNGDEGILYYFIGLRSRIFSLVRGLKNEYEIVKKNKLFLNTSRDRFDDGTINERNTSHQKISNLAAYTAQEIITYPPHEATVYNIMRILNLEGKVSKVSLISVLNNIRTNRAAMVEEIIELTLELFVEKKNGTIETIRSHGYLIFLLELYSASNTKDGRIDKIKADLDIILKESSMQYANTEREATRSDLRKAVFLYFMLMAQKLS